jgi:hypothetical protein
VVYEGENPATGQPIIKAFLNPLVSWIWAGVLLMVWARWWRWRPASRRRGRDSPQCWQPRRNDAKTVDNERWTAS